MKSSHLGTCLTVLALLLPLAVRGSWETVSFQLWTDTSVYSNCSKQNGGTHQFSSELTVGKCFAVPPAGYGKITRATDGNNATLDIYLV
jgi:hypothetical protein